jgi:hypothetical protein
VADGFEIELVKATERGQIRASEGSVKHVEVFLMGASELPSSGDLDAYPGADVTHHPAVHPHL